MRSYSWTIDWSVKIVFTVRLQLTDSNTFFNVAACM